MTTTTTTLGILGVGRLGEAIAQAMLDLPNQGELLVTPRNRTRVSRLCELDSRVRPCDPREILQSSDCVVVALGPEGASEVLGELTFEPRHHVISVMAEVSLYKLQQLTAGAGSASRVLALPSVARGGQPLPVYPLTDEVQRLFGGNNSLIVADSERELLTFWSITGLLSSVLTLGAVAADWLEDAGIDRQLAEVYASTLFQEVHGLTANGFEEALQHVSTPNGLNVMMREQLQQADLEGQLRDGLDQINHRLMSRGINLRDNNEACN